MGSLRQVVQLSLNTEGPQEPLNCGIEIDCSRMWKRDFFSLKGTCLWLFSVKMDNKKKRKT